MQGRESEKTGDFEAADRAVKSGGKGAPEAESRDCGGGGGPSGESCSCGAAREKMRDAAEYRDLMNRLNRVEGQIRGIKNMLEKNAYCIDILNQVSAANCALNSFNKVLLANHLRSCVAEDVRRGSGEKLDELVKTLQKLMK